MKLARTLLRALHGAPGRVPRGCFDAAAPFPADCAARMRIPRRPRRAVVVALLLLSWLSTACSKSATVEGTLVAYVGAASKPAAEEAALLYEQETGVRVALVFGGSGVVLSQMKLAQQGDLYFPGSSDYMEKAKRDGDVLADTERILVYLVPAILVQKGNPHGIRSLEDLTRPGLRVAIADPEGVCVGAYAVEIVERALSSDELAALRRNLINYTESCEKTATAVALRMADAVLGWSVFEHWDPERIEIVPLRAKEIPRIGYVPIAVSRFTKQRAAAERFIDFLAGPSGRAVFARHAYFATAEDAAAWIGAPRPVGGEYGVPPEWIGR